MATEKWDLQLEVKGCIELIYLFQFEVTNWTPIFELKVWGIIWGPLCASDWTFLTPFASWHDMTVTLSLPLRLACQYTSSLGGTCHVIIVETSLDGGILSLRILQTYCLCAWLQLILAHVYIYIQALGPPYCSEILVQVIFGGFRYNYNLKWRRWNRR